MAENAENAKPFDQAFKSLPEASTRGFLDVMGVLDPAIEAEVELLPQELVLPAVSMDVGLLVRPRGERPFIAIFEAFAVFRPRSLDQVLAYNKALDAKSEFLLRTCMVPLVERGCPRNALQLLTRDKGGYVQHLHLNWIRPWEIDAAVLLAQNKPEFDAWTAVFRSTAQQQQEAMRRLRSAPDAMARFKTLGGLRYRGKEYPFWKAFTERIDQMLTKEDLRESLAVQEWLEEGRKEGRKQGRQEGNRATAEQWLRTVLARFPGIALPAVLPASADLAKAAREVTFAPDESSARAVLTAHGLIPGQ